MSVVIASVYTTAVSGICTAVLPHVRDRYRLQSQCHAQSHTVTVAVSVLGPIKNYINVIITDYSDMVLLLLVLFIVFRLIQQNNLSPDRLQSCRCDDGVMGLTDVVSCHVLLMANSGEIQMKSFPLVFAGFPSCEINFPLWEI